MAVSALVAAIWVELWIGLAGVLAGAIFATLLPRLAAHRGAGKWIPLHWRRLALAVHGAVIIREVWRSKPNGTCRAYYSAARSWFRGQGFNLVLPNSPFAAKAAATEEDDDVMGVASPAMRDPIIDRWYVGEKDLAFFQYHAEQDGPVEGASAWQLMMEKDVPNTVRYTAWRRTLPGGKTEYKSVTLCPDATAQEFNDLYFDDDFRVNWDEMVIHHEVLEQGDHSQRQQVVRWIRRFPFSFLSDREYSIARRMFRVGDKFYGLTKAVEHPGAPATGKVVHMDVFHSMWESHDVPCPWNSGRPACQTTLLHHEQFKIPENMARFAVRVGMWGFVKKMSEEVPKFIAARRLRAAPHEVDPQAYGAGLVIAPSRPLMRRGLSGLTSSSCTLSSMASCGALSEAGEGYAQAEAYEMYEPVTPQQGSKLYIPRGSAAGRAKSLLVMVAVGAALLLRRRGGANKVRRGPALSGRQHRSSSVVQQELKQ